MPKNVKGTLRNFLTSIVVQNIEKNERGPFGAIQKVSKKSHSAEKSGAMGDPYCDFEIPDVCFVFSFRFGRAAEVGVVEV